MRSRAAERLSQLAWPCLDRWRPDMGGAVVCAVSGGVDSMCLLHLCAAWGKERGVKVIAAHFHHGLRGEAADRDEAFVRRWCEERDIPFTADRGDTARWAREHSLTVEEAGRNLRYSFLHRAAEESGAGLILTAHHADDNAETILLNLCRGTGLAGLTGIPPRRGNIARPLIEATREEIAAYASAWSIPHVEDETNESDFAARNLLRHQVMPVLRQINPKVSENMARCAAIVREENDALTGQVQGLLACARYQNGGVRLPAEALLRAPESLRPRLLLELWKGLEAGRKDLGSVHLQGLIGLSEGDEMDLPHGFTAVRRKGVLELMPRRRPEREHPLTVGSSLEWGDFSITCRAAKPGSPGRGTLILSWDGEVLSVGPWRPGDRLELPGTRGNRGVKRIFADRGIPPQRRDLLPAFYADGRLAAVWGLGVDKGFLPRKGRGAIEIEIKEKGYKTWEKA